MNNLVVWDRRYVVVYVKPEHRLELLKVANKLSRFGLHVETILGRRGVIFGSLPSQDDPEKILMSVPEVSSWSQEK